MSESALQKRVRLALSDAGHVFWRNNIGVAEFFNERSETPEHVAYGVGGPGGSDLIGMVAVSPMFSRFVALELKPPGARTAPKRAALQEQFRALVRSGGGFACVVRSTTEALAACERARTGASE